MQAQMLVILSDVAGVLTGDPRERPNARLIALIADAEAEMKGLVADSAGPLGTGGMASKLKAARQATRAGIAVKIIASGHEPGALRDAIDPERERGTLVLPARTRLRSRKHWIAFALKPQGALALDRGAADALRNKGRSLLPSGVRDVTGEFADGDCVYLLDPTVVSSDAGLIAYPTPPMLATTRNAARRRSRQLSATWLANKIIHHRGNLDTTATGRFE